MKIQVNSQYKGQLLLNAVNEILGEKLYNNAGNQNVIAYDSDELMKDIFFHSVMLNFLVPTSKNIYLADKTLEKLEYINRDKASYVFLRGVYGIYITKLTPKLVKRINNFDKKLKANALKKAKNLLA